MLVLVSLLRLRLCYFCIYVLLGFGDSNRKCVVFLFVVVVDLVVVCSCPAVKLNLISDIFHANDLSPILFTASFWPFLARSRV